MSKENIFLTPEKKVEIADFLKDILENAPPYKVIEVKFSLNDIIMTLQNSPKPNLLCNNCNERKTFLREYVTFNGDKLVEKLLNGIEDKDAKKSFISLGYKCVDCGTAYFFTLLFDEGRVKKIGQYPSFAELSQQNAEKYKNVMSKYYIEYKQSLSAYSQRMGVAAFVYLRRILEDVVNKKYRKLENTNPQDKFIDRLKEVEKTEEIIPNEISKIKEKIYTVLSKGVHEYSEKECLELYEPLRYIIELIVDKQLEEKNRSEKIKNAIAAILEKAGRSNE